MYIVNPKIVNAMVKKYIKPTAKAISLDVEHNIMLNGSLVTTETAEGGDAMTNGYEFGQNGWNCEDWCEE